MPDRKPHVVLLGATGQVGRALVGPLGKGWRLTTLDRTEADLSQPERAGDVVRALGPDVIVNAAGYTSVDNAEREPDLAYTINAAAPHVLADVARSCGAAIIHYSSDYVFDGRKEAPYRETDIPAPLSVYGSTKLAGDVAVASACARHLILRTSWVYSAHGRNFLTTILRLGAGREELRVVADQVGAPTSARLVAEVTALLLAGALDSTAGNSAWGLYNVAAAGEASWYTYARHIVMKAQESGCALRLEPGGVKAVTSADYSAAAPRPANSRLDTAKLRDVLALDLPPWERDVDATIHDLRTAAR